MQSDRIPVFEASLRRSNVVVKMSQQLPYLNFPIVEGPKSSYIYGLDDTGAGLNLVNFECYQSVAERQPNLVFKSSYLKDMENVDPYNISAVDGGGKVNMEG